MVLVYPITLCRCPKDHTFVGLILVFVISGIRKYIVFRIPFNTVHGSSTGNMMYCFSGMNIWLCHKQANFVWAILQYRLMFLFNNWMFKLTISMNKSSLAEAIKSPVWLKLIVRTGHLRNITFQISRKINTKYISKNNSWIQ